MNADGQPQHGGVNPIFTNYDEVWQWIPTVTGNSENCRSQIIPARRPIEMNRQNTELLNNLRLPTYSEAVNSNQTGRVLSTNVRMTTNVTSTNSGVVRNNQNQTNLRPALNQQTPNSTQIARVHNQLDNIRAPRNQASALSGSQHVTNISVSTTSGVSALQQARDLVNRAEAIAEGNRPMPSAPTLQIERSQGATGVVLNSLNETQSNHPTNSSSATSDNVNGQSRGRSNDIRQSSDYSGELRQAAQAIYPVHGHRQHPVDRVQGL